MKEATVQAIQAAPSVGAVMIWLAGIPVEKWAGFAGLVFLVVQTLGYLWRLRRDVLREDERRRAGLPPPATDRGGL